MRSTYHKTQHCPWSLHYNSLVSDRLLDEMQGYVIYVHVHIDKYDTYKVLNALKHHKR